MVRFFTLILILSGLSACSLLDVGSRERSAYDPDPEIQRYYTEKKVEERNQARTQLGRSRGMGDDPQVEMRITLNRLEQQIPTHNEKALYYKFKPYFPSDAARIEFLRIPSYEAKSEWLRRNQVTTEVYEHSAVIQDLINNNDICLGMTKQAVTESWGEPDTREIAGNPIYGNERWKYSISKSGEAGFTQESRFVFFEGGIVSGWEKF